MTPLAYCDYIIDYAAKRDKTGSKFIKALVPVFNKFAHCDDVRTLGDKVYVDSKVRLK